MKKIVLLAMLFLSISSLSYAQKGAQFKWNKTIHDFGEFKEGETQHYTFEFTNTGDKPLVIYKASVSCGCTTVDWDKKPVAPGKTGQIKVSYDSKGKPYPFNKSIWIMSNVSSSKANSNVELKIKGVAK